MKQEQDTRGTYGQEGNFLDCLLSATIELSHSTPVHSVFLEDFGCLEICLAFVTSGGWTASLTLVARFS
jgi:hypothetical protein